MLRRLFGKAAWRLFLNSHPLIKHGSEINVASGVRISVTDGAALCLGSRVSIDRNATLLAKFGALTIGEGTYIGTGSMICARDCIIIGSNVLIAEYVSIRDQDHALDVESRLSQTGFTTGPITIGDDVWLGAKVTVTKGVTIGRGSVIGANAVVTQDIPPFSLALGVPARVVRQLSP